MDGALGMLAEYLQYPFVQYAFMVGVLIALCSSLLGVTLVLRHFSYIGDGLSHVAFGALAVAAVTGLTDSMVLTLPVTIAAALVLLSGGQKARIQGDAAIAMLAVGALAVGYLLMNMFPTSGNVSGDVCTTLFGSVSILTLTRGQVLLCVVLSLVTLVAFALLYNKLFAISFDEQFSRATGVSVRALNVVLATLIAVVIVLAMSLVGALLVSALIVFPALSAMRVCRSYRSVTVCAAALSVACTAGGLVASILAGTPVGATIVLVDMVAFAVCFAAGKARGLAPWA